MHVHVVVGPNEMKMTMMFVAVATVMIVVIVVEVVVEVGPIQFHPHRLKVRVKPGRPYTLTRHLRILVLDP